MDIKIKERNYKKLIEKPIHKKSKLNIILYKQIFFNRGEASQSQWEYLFSISYEYSLTSSQQNKSAIIE